MCPGAFIFNIIVLMKTIKYTTQALALVLIVIALQSCDKKYDDKGRLLVKYINTNTGSLNFTPMMRSDSVSTKMFKPDTLLMDGKPYTGGIAEYDQHQKLIIEGFVKNGLMDSSWKFYYASGGTLMEGKYKNGVDIGMWHSYYGYNKPKITKLYDNYGYMLMRVEYFDNGKIKNYQNVKATMFGDKERNFTNDQHGDLISMYVEDSVFVVKQGDKAERIGKNIFTEGQSHLDIAK